MFLGRDVFFKPSGHPPDRRHREELSTGRTASVLQSLITGSKSPPSLQGRAREQRCVVLTKTLILCSISCAFVIRVQLMWLMGWRKRSQRLMAGVGRTLTQLGENVASLAGTRGSHAPLPPAARLPRWIKRRAFGARGASSPWAHSLGIEGNVSV